MNPSMTKDQPTYDFAFRVLESATQAEQTEQYFEAVDRYNSAAQALLYLADRENDPMRKQRAEQRTKQVQRRAAALQDWLRDIDEGKDVANCPSVGIHGHPHAIDVSKRVQEAVARKYPGSNGTAPFPNDKSVQPLEFSHLTYTPVCSKQAEEFSADGYSMLCQRVRPGRVRIYCTVTMYNEDASELKGTLTAIARNVEYMQARNEGSWEEVCVCVVSDGRYKANKDTLSWLHSMGLYDEDTMVQHEILNATNVHLFERTIQLVDDGGSSSSSNNNNTGSSGSSIFGSSSSKGNGRWLPPLQVQFALKQHNAQKLDSHQWFFYAFARHIQPDYTVLVDVGTMAAPSAIHRLVDCMDRNASVGGVCGEIAVDPNQRKVLPYLSHFFTTHCMLDWIVVGAQHFEYKVSNIMDKSLESTFGFISVLPGAFSAYRLRAIDRNPTAGAGAGADGRFDTEFPLKAYFDKSDKGLIKGNMYLAEDRILCFELIARHNCAWTMQYVKGAVAYTDVPGNVVDLLKQRRRWLNGSFFATVNAIQSFPRFFKHSSHSATLKLAITIEFLYNLLTLLLSWVLPANFYLSVYFALHLTFPGSLLSEGIHGVYVFLVLMQFMFGLGNKMGPYKSKNSGRAVRAFYSISTVLFGLIMMLVSALSVYQLYNLATGDVPLKLTDGYTKGIFRGQTFTCSIDTFSADFLPAVKSSCSSLDSPSVETAFQNSCSSKANPVTLSGGFDRVSTLGTCALSWQMSVGVAVLSMGAYFISAAIHMELHHIMAYLLHYFFMLPAFVNIFMLYSFCNLHDLSWGTKGLEAAGGGHGSSNSSGSSSAAGRRSLLSASNISASESSPEDALKRQAQLFRAKEAEAALEKDNALKMDNEFKFFRSTVLTLFILSNALVIYVMRTQVGGACYLTGMALLVAGFNGFRLLMSTIFAIRRTYPQPAKVAHSHSRQVGAGYAESRC